MSDVSRLPESSVSAGRTVDPGELWGLVMLWSGPLTVFGFALFLAR